jgi:excisionase family DNA binding protein
MTTTEAAISLGVHSNTVLGLIRREIISGEMVGNRWLILRSDVEELAKTYTPLVGRPRRRRRRRTQGQEAGNER